MDVSSNLSDEIIPGMLIGSESEIIGGPGTYISNGNVFASLVGRKVIIPQNDESSDPKPVVSVQPVGFKSTLVAPMEKSVVLAQVTKITTRFAAVAIVSVDDVTVSEYFPGTIRVNDVKAGSAEQVEIYKSFRPGDVIKAEVISLGDSRSYYLTTAKDEYGVVMAKSISGQTMTPISQNLMQCPKTQMKEFRKVALVPAKTQQI